MKENAFARELRAKYELTLDGYGDTAFAPNGQPYVVLRGIGGEDEAAQAFAEQLARTPGAESVNWRVVPEVQHVRGYGEVFYMRLLFIA